MSFIFVYKVGQAKIDFLERQFGEGVSQKILSDLIDGKGNREFSQVVIKITGKSKEELESLWRVDLNKTYLAPSPADEANFSHLQEVPGVGENLDRFDISPDGETLAIREVHPLTGVVSIQLMPVRGTPVKTEVINDLQYNVLGLYVLEADSFTLADQRIAYFLKTPMGPVLEWREFRREGDRFSLQAPRRFSLQQLGILNGREPSLDKAGQRLAFVGLKANGWQSLVIFDFKTESARELRAEPYSWDSLDWVESQEGPEMLLGASNRFASEQRDLFWTDPSSQEIELFSDRRDDPKEVRKDRDGPLLFRSDSSGSIQIHALDVANFKERQITRVPTMATNPVWRTVGLYFLAFRSGHYRMYRVTKEALNMSRDISHDQQEGALKTRPNMPETLAASPTQQSLWTPALADFESGQVQDYKAFRTAGYQFDYLSGYLSSGGTTGLFASASDLMRNYRIDANIVSPDDPDSSLVQLQYLDQKGRSTWVAGFFRTTQTRADLIFADVDDRQYYRHTEWGALGAYVYPLSVLSSVGVGARVSSVGRGNYSDKSRETQWGQAVRSQEFLISPSTWYGYDRVLYEAITGPIRGSSWLIEGGTAYYANQGSFNHRARMDFSAYRQLYGTRTVLVFKSIFGASFGDRFREPFWLWSDEILRAYLFADRRLLGNYIAAAKTELRFPVGTLFDFPYLRGVLAYDYGTVAQEIDVLEKGISSSWSLGGSLSLPPLAIEIVTSFPIEVAEGPKESSVVHFRLQYLYQ